MGSPPISSLPNELLLEVFREVMIFPDPFWRLDYTKLDELWARKPYIRIVTLTHVCRRWRAIGLHAPEFWTTVDANRSLDCYNAFLERSRSRPLTVNMAGWIRPGGMDPELLLLEVPRCRSLSIDHGTSYSEKLFADPSLWHQCAQVLDSLTLWYYNPGDTPDRSPSPFDLELSSLKSLSLHQWGHESLADVRCPQLTKLVVSNGLDFPWTEWLEYLRNFPLLQVLDLSCVVHPEPLIMSISNTLPDAIVHLPHLSSLSLVDSQPGPDDDGLFEAHDWLGELALFNHLEIPSHTALDFSIPHTETIPHIFETIGARITRPFFRGRYSLHAPAIIAICYRKNFLDISVWDTMPIPATICWQWQRCRSHPPPPSLKLHCSLDRFGPRTQFFGHVTEFLSKAYPLHMVETLVFAAVPESRESTPQVVNAFKGILQKMVNVRTLYLEGHHVAELLKSVLSQPEALRSDGEPAPEEATRGNFPPFPFLKIIGLEQSSTVEYIISPYQQRYKIPVPTISQIVDVLQECKSNTDRCVDIVHICVKWGRRLPYKGDCGGACFRTTDLLRPKLLPLLGSDTFSILDRHLRSELGQDDDAVRS
ncbi:hypothetical protein EIP86_009646 [Pleurotus ostreatoroseus]|nr:hypothetical protein EIP86_009646 [Pleurotus ostreatoroseus]